MERCAFPRGPVKYARYQSATSGWPTDKPRVGLGSSDEAVVDQHNHKDETDGEEDRDQHREQLGRRPGIGIKFRSLAFGVLDGTLNCFRVRAEDLGKPAE